MIRKTGGEKGGVRDKKIVSALSTVSALNSHLLTAADST